MSRSSMDIYAERARKIADPLLASARYADQRQAARLIVPDVARKLDLGRGHRLLDIGCGVGMVTVPVSFLVAETHAVDSAECIIRVIRSAPQVFAHAGDFLEIDAEPLGMFDRVLAYDVLQYLGRRDEVWRFVRKAIELLRPGGRALFGDLPNRDLRARFVSGPAGAAFDAEWRSRPHDDGGADLPTDPELVTVDDRLVLELVAMCRGAGFHAYLLPQEPRLPFGNTREDLLVMRPA